MRPHSVIFQLPVFFFHDTFSYGNLVFTDEEWHGTKTSSVKATMMTTRIKEQGSSSPDDENMKQPVNNKALPNIVV